MTDIIWLESIDSTNNEAKRLLPDIRRNTVIAAKKQTSGRGQRGNVWKSGASENLTFSIALNLGSDDMKEIPANCQFVISEAVALGITDYLSACGITASIKWPNDIYAGDRKICGILIENSVSANYIKTCIAGIGLNVNQNIFPEDLPNPVSMAMLTHRVYTLEDELGKLIEYIFLRLADIYSDADKLEKDYLRHLYRKDEVHKYIDKRSGVKFDGIIRGINESAQLIIEDTEGRFINFYFKEVEYII